MKKTLLLVFLAFSFVIIFSGQGLTQVNEYSLVPVDLQVDPCDSLIQVNINIKTVETIKALMVPLFAEGTSNPVLDTILTGGLSSANPNAFAPPSLVWDFPVKWVNPYGPPSDPLLFLAVGFGAGTIFPNSNGLYCRMFYKVTGPGTLTFRTAVHSTAGPVMMQGSGGSPAPINWPAEGEVGSFVVTGVNAYCLAPINPKVLPGGGIVQVNLNIGTIDSIRTFMVPLFAEGTSNPVLDTVLTGGLGDTDPPGFASPSLVSGFSTKYINPYGLPTDPLIFMAHNYATSLPPNTGLFCKMFYKVSGPGTLTFRTAVHSTAGAIGMWRPDATPAPLNWPPSDFVGSFVVLGYRGDVNDDNRLSVSDVIYLINYLFRGGPEPLHIDSGDVDCSGGLPGIPDVIYLVNYLFKGGPPPC
jgi:hypothetical protein